MTFREFLLVVLIALAMMLWWNLLLDGFEWLFTNQVEIVAPRAPAARGVR